MPPPKRLMGHEYQATHAACIPIKQAHETELFLVGTYLETLAVATAPARPTMLQANVAVASFGAHGLRLVVVAPVERLKYYTLDHKNGNDADNARAKRKQASTLGLHKHEGG